MKQTYQVPLILSAFIGALCIYRHRVKLRKRWVIYPFWFPRIIHLAISFLIRRWEQLHKYDPQYPFFIYRLLYLVDAYMDPLPKMLAQQHSPYDDPDTTMLEGLESGVPTIQVLVHCFHEQTEWFTEWVQDSRGHWRRELNSRTYQVTTHKQTHELPIQLRHHMEKKTSEFRIPTFWHFGTLVFIVESLKASDNQTKAVLDTFKHSVEAVHSNCDNQRRLTMEFDYVNPVERRFFIPDLTYPRFPLQTIYFIVALCGYSFHLRLLLYCNCSIRVHHLERRLTVLNENQEHAIMVHKRNKLLTLFLEINRKIPESIADEIISFLPSSMFLPEASECLKQI